MTQNHTAGETREAAEMLRFSPGSPGLRSSDRCSHDSSIQSSRNVVVREALLLSLHSVLLWDCRVLLLLPAGLLGQLGQLSGDSQHFVSSGTEDPTIRFSFPILQAAVFHWQQEYCL